MPTKGQKIPLKLTIDLQYGGPAIESAVSKVASSVLIKKWVKSATPLSGLITLRFVNAAEGKKLNLAFRQKDYATNVLTFPYELSKEVLTADIIFCLPALQKEAKEQDKTLKAHLAHLIVHGCLHAQGHDHEITRDAKKMESLEIQILQELGFANPYS
ncbi:rRNA maturation RNase YbeY [Polynucleobacter sp. JS-Safj-400b-B2]|uniref:rRNA maturation RNase YbeY n=1 Tax=Polynucleobacter sp. JS-Safj-400b-B2 TaxID=2576921 RepID=UPI001C0AE97E|nr:rRNA maturation RNase YbeY [Polynucleobacter sp. JS-Safj-400b-B2]MBU3625398.1 rRNA maturation RNase YbeY [Polynucleobacter sp. JS-Safj-400b-B2]